MLMDPSKGKQEVITPNNKVRCISSSHSSCLALRPAGLGPPVMVIISKAAMAPADLDT